MVDWPHDGAEGVFRDYATEGVPASGKHKPLKSHIRDLLTEYEEVIAASLDNNAASTIVHLVDSGSSTGDNFLATPIPTITELNEHVIYWYEPAATNATTAPTVKILALPSIALVEGDGSALIAGRIVEGVTHLIRYDPDANKFRIIAPPAPAELFGTTSGDDVYVDGMRVAFQVTDEDGRIGLAVTAGGTVVPGHRTGSVFPELSHFVMFSQSLGIGIESAPTITTTDTKWGSLMMALGTPTVSDVTQSGPTAPELALRRTPWRRVYDFSLVPLVATGLFETMAPGLCDHMKAGVVGRFAPYASDVAPHFMWSNSCLMAKMIDEISVLDHETHASQPSDSQLGGGYYITALDDIARAKAQAESKGWRYGVPAMLWMQGESNTGATYGAVKPSRWQADLAYAVGVPWYRDKLIGFREQFEQDVKSLTGQEHDLPMFTYQTQNQIGHAQLAAANLDPNIFMVGSYYQMASSLNSRYTGVFGGSIHMSADAERWLGVQFAKVIRRVMQEGENWSPLQALQANYDTATQSVLVKFHVPRGQLVLDETFLPKQHYPNGSDFAALYGFEVMLTGYMGTRQALSAVTIESNDTVRITLATALTPGSTYTVQYGQQTTAGNIGAIVAVDTTTVPDFGSRPRSAMSVAGDWMSVLQPLLDEGAFFLYNPTSSRFATIRTAFLDGANTTFWYIDDEVTGTGSFTIGEDLVIARAYAFGNLRDTDDEVSVHSFGDAAYGTRTGPYPLWNWCVGFADIPVLGVTA